MHRFSAFHHVSNILPCLPCRGYESSATTCSSSFACSSNAAAVRCAATSPLRQPHPAVAFQMPPPRRSPSPPALETCSPPSSDLDHDGYIGSDDELDTEARARQRRRIESLAGAYLQGKPLFILSASLRGPFDDQQWTNPWRKNRRQSGQPEDNPRKSRKRVEGTDSPVIQETNPRKRRQPPDSQEVRLSQPPPTPSNPSASLFRSKKVMSEKHGGSSCPRPVQRVRSEHSASPASVPKAATKAVGPTVPSGHSTPIRGTDKSWLKKDRDRLIKFHNFDPPTSPTSKISSRPQTSKRRAVKGASSASHLNTPGSERPDTASPSPDNRSPSATPNAATHQTDHLVVTNESAASHYKDSHLNAPPNVTRPADQEKSFSVLSSSSHLPQFEFRRKKRRSATPKESVNAHSTASSEDREHADHSANHPAVVETAEVSDQPDQVPQEEPLAQPSTQGRAEVNQTEGETNPQQSHTTTVSSNTFENVPVSHSDQAPSPRNPSHATSERLPSAQVIQQNPAISGYMTSLHSTAVPKGGTEDDESTVPDHFSTQAALLLAQRSFQKDLESQRHEAETPDKKRRASDLSRSPSPASNNITPFYRLSTPDYPTGRSEQFRAKGMGAHMMSTQGMIDAVTPFTFSTEKKENFRRILTPASAPGSKKPRTGSFVDTSPASPRHNEFLFDSRVERVPNSVQSHRLDTQPSALPMTLTGTTPPTAQNAQDGFPAPESFNLSQAIAEAGSWLQQSFEINKEISQCRTAKSGPSPSDERPQPGLDIGAIS